VGADPRTCRRWPRTALTSLPGTLAFGYWIAAALWNRGLTTAAARLAVAHAFDVLRAPRVLAVTLPDNHASVRVLDKLGLPAPARCATPVASATSFAAR